MTISCLVVIIIYYYFLKNRCPSKSRCIARGDKIYFKEIVLNICLDNLSPHLFTLSSRHLSTWSCTSTTQLLFWALNTWAVMSHLCLVNSLESLGHSTAHPFGLLDNSSYSATTRSLNLLDTWSTRLLTVSYSTNLALSTRATHWDSVSSLHSDNSDDSAMHIPLGLEQCTSLAWFSTNFWSSQMHDMIRPSW